MSPFLAHHTHHVSDTEFSSMNVKRALKKYIHLFHFWQRNSPPKYVSHMAALKLAY